MLSVANVATPLTAATVVDPERIPPAGFVPIATDTLPPKVVTVFPTASCTVTSTGGVMVAPALVSVGCTENFSCDAAPVVTSNTALTPDVRELAEAVRVEAAPVLLILRVEKAAVPPTAATAVVPVSVAPAVPLPGVIAIVTVPVKLGTGLPPASCAATWIAGVIVVPATVDTGCTVKTSFAAAPTSTENALLVAPLTPPAAVDTARVYPLPALSMLSVEKLATPAA